MSSPTDAIREIDLFMTEATWDPQNFKKSPDVYAWNTFFIIQHIFGVLFNTMVIGAAVRHRKRLFSSPADILYIVMCTFNVLLGIAVLSIRFVLASIWSWPYSLCHVISAVTLLGETVGLVMILVMSGERICANVIDRPMTMKQVGIGIGNALVAGAFNLWLHMGLAWERPIISACGLFCYSNALASPVAIIDLLLLISSGSLVICAYALIFHRLRKLYLASKQATPVGSSNNAQLVQQQQGNSTESARDRRNMQLQRKIAFRGALAFGASCFTLIPTAGVVFSAYFTGQRSEATEFTLILCKFFTECSDPLILLYMDLRFRRAVGEMYFWWVPQRFLVRIGFARKPTAASAKSSVLTYAAAAAVPPKTAAVTSTF
ncbi:hypothetical protein BC828DRAFT_393924 [Blastocladiella britannica]|nr:hypothetical protein BC828DRAFT_393924 [Blastocladiella britannica]